ncbi:expressed unknown protein [Seminavis robusta]|uniref:Uncharacterized protein n=1 Tax=Seminavis robusta TaxID=568900 RepID=A0A9N8F206_9STRA|nr:expressed unknown protein [Seminavis robusta]|eukprot:Sro3326_g346840.1 n/a (456) ;mRNA; r:4606-5973
MPRNAKTNKSMISDADNISKYRKRRNNAASYVSVFLYMIGSFSLGFFWNQLTSAVFQAEQEVVHEVALSSFLDIPSPHKAASNNLSEENNNDKRQPQQTDHKDFKFIIYHETHEAQGEGNHMHGLLAAHLLGDEFHRVVCVSSNYKHFHVAWKAIDPTAVEHCPDIVQRHNKEPPDTKKDHTIELLNYRSTPPNECTLRGLLESSARVLHLAANTYPRWPTVPKHINFFTFYQAKPILLEILPYSQPPPIVIHLRKPDIDGGDRRKGVDEASIRALGEHLLSQQPTPFLVTNNVPWYDMVEQEPMKWSHPFWYVVSHSALRFTWGANFNKNNDDPNGNNNNIRIYNPTNAKAVLLQQKYKQLRQQMGVDEVEILQLWADWYTLLKAKSVYHTFSDFSLSAVHWQGTWSRTFDGIDEETGNLILLEENWVVDGATPRLVDRTKEDLNNCDQARRGY